MKEATLLEKKQGHFEIACGVFLKGDFQGRTRGELNDAGKFCPGEGK